MSGRLVTSLLGSASPPRALAAAGYHQLTQLTMVSEQVLGRLHGVGPKAIGILRAELAAQGLSFAAD